MTLSVRIAFLLTILSPGLFASGQVNGQTFTHPSGAWDLERYHGSVHTASSWRFPKQTHNPDVQEQKRMRVDWGKAAMGRLDWEEATVNATLKWIENESVWDRELGIRGMLQIVSEDGKSVKPVDWCQGVRVIIARSPNMKPDWSKRHDEKDSAWSDCVVEKNGSFIARLRPEDIRRPPGESGDFLVALCLGVKSGGSISWKNSVPVLPQSISTVRISGPKPLSPTLQFINGAPSVHARDFDPVMLIRAVNHLHALGKDKAIAGLRAYLEVARRSFMVRRDPANIDTSDYECVFLIVRLLFEPAKPAEQLPSVGIGVMAPSPAEGDSSWPLFPLALQGDIPFMLIRGTMGAGLPQHPRAHVDWAEKHGKLRARPLRPADDPLAALESLWSLPQTRRLFHQNDPFVGDAMLRDQAWRMVENVVGPWRTSEAERCSRKYDPKADWEKHKRIFQGIKIRWDAAQQKYVAR